MQKQVAYTEAIERKYPQPVVYAIAKDQEGKANPITLGWFMCTSHHPPMLAISVAFDRFSYNAIKHSKSFTVVFPSENQANEALFFGTRSGADTDKLTEYGTQVESAVKIDSVILQDAAANFECVLEDELATGDHVIFVGRVVASHVNTEQVGRLYSMGPDSKIRGVSEKSKD